jgi:CelD/BcsL family acetyltransferase involved in cellulose biosynthesis
MYEFKVELFDLNKVKNKLENFQYIKKSFFYDNEWLESCYENQINKKDIFIVEIFNNKEILLIMFFEIKKFLFFKKLIWLFDKDLNFITPIIVKDHDFDQKEFNRILKKIFNHFKVDLIQLDKNPLTINDIKNPLNLHRNFKFEKILKINLKNNSWNDYYEKISSSKTKQTDRRKEKLLSKKGKINFLIAKDLKNKKKILDFAFENKVKYLEKKKLNTTNFKNLYRKLFMKINRNSQYICSALKVNEKIIAAIIARIDKKKYYYLIPSTNENEYLKYSPGRILLKEQIKWCFENDINNLDFGPGEFEYKKQWSNDNDIYFKILEYKSYLGVILYFLYRVKFYHVNFNFFNYIRNMFIKKM